MSVDRFKFISPGVFVNEIDNTGRSATPADIGPVLIGRSEKGPILRPTRVKDFADFITEFGMPIPGGDGKDVSRDGNYISPTYAAYAAQAWLRNNSPITYVRLGGQSSEVATADDAGALAGWTTTVLSASTEAGNNGGAYGLFVALSESAPASTPTTGTLAAVWYMNTGSSIGLSGTFVDNNNPTLQVASSVAFRSISGQEFKVQIKDGDGNTLIDTAFDFSETSDKFARKVFNTNPTLTNSSVTSDTQLERYWLGETFEGNVNDILGTSTNTLGAILPLVSGSKGATGFFADRRKDYQEAKTGWFIAQDMTQGESTGSFQADEMPKLFRVVAQNAGSWSSRNLKISIQDLKRSANSYQNYGSFTLAIRKMSDTDNRVEYLEQWTNLNLNPNSENYIARRIGDNNQGWDNTNRRYKEFGNYTNNSKYIRIEMNTAVDKGDTDAAYLPFGVLGPLRYNSFADNAANPQATTMVSGGLDDTGHETPEALVLLGDSTISGSTGTIQYDWPKLRLRTSASQGDPTDPRNVWFGVDTTFNSNRLNRSVLDILRPLARLTDDFSADVSTTTSFVFTLDDMCNTDNTGALTGSNVYISGSRSTASEDRNANYGYTRGTGSYVRVIEDAGCDRFTTVLFGGFDGLNIKEATPLRTVNQNTTDNPDTDYMFNSCQVAIDSLRDPEVVEYNLAAMPGIINNTLNRSLVDMCEQRGDALAVIDIKNGYTPKYESTADEASRLGNVDQAITNMRNNLALNSSYGCAYYPWVQIRDTNTGQLVWAPPSIAALGAMSYSQKSSELWFAPAGFTRGGLSLGNAGVPVAAVRQRLTSKQRDKLYDASINPIAQFPAEGIVIFGQKTLQATPSALDRINVRRLLIYLKRQISRFAATVLFDQNVRSTWNRFKGRVEPFLASVQAGLGITKFKLVLDETTTTEDLIDRNIMYAKIFIKPARAIEFIALDFILTDDGAAFED
tara:strand:- start:1867 stop:4755 length:2889 start_codon:yes stop_codon:yes gene_type:complete